MPLQLIMIIISCAYLFYNCNKLKPILDFTFHQFKTQENNKITKLAEFICRVPILPRVFIHVLWYTKK